MTLLQPFLAVGLFVAAALGQTHPSVTVEGVSGKALVVTPADLSRLPQQTVNAMDHAKPATFEGVFLKDVLAKVDLPTGDNFHSTAASYYVIVEGKDGYRAVFAWAELDPTFMEKSIYLVMKRDGKALTENDGLLQLVVPGEKRGARWVRQVTALRIKRAD